MEEEKAAAYYDELTRKGEGAARFKQGLGFSAAAGSGDTVFTKPSGSSFLSSFVRASSPSTTSKLEKEAQLESIQNKLKKKPSSSEDNKHSRVSEKRERESSHRLRSPSTERDCRERHLRRRSRSRERYRDRDRDKERRRKSRSRSRSRSPRRERRRSERRSWSRSLSPRRERRSERRSRSRSLSPRRERRTDKRGSDDRVRERGGRRVGKEGTGGVDYARLIQGYDKMSPAERVKAKMKLQLAETADKDATKGMGGGWERFEFNKDAPLDDEELEAAEDDAILVKHISQSFRFSAVEARREDQVKAAHDEAMFGAPTLQSVNANSEEEEVDNDKNTKESGHGTSLLSEKVLAKQQGSWRDRARRL